MAEVRLDAEIREGRGKGPARRLRALGRVPATLYGRGSDPISVAVDARALGTSLATDAGINVLIDLQLNGEHHLTLARELARHPVRGDILHVDFLKIARDQRIAVDVPIHFEGESQGVKEGGVLEHHLWQLHVECLAISVPERVNVGISEMLVGDAIRVSQVSVPEGVTVLTAPDEVIVTCVIPQKLEELLPTPEGEVPEGEEAAAAAEGEAAAAAGGEQPAAEGESES